MTKKAILHIIISIILIAPAAICHAYAETADTRADSVLRVSADSLSKIINPKDTLSAKKKTSGLDSTVTYYAKDTVRFVIPERRLRLRGDAKLDYKTQSLKAEAIELYMGQSLLKAVGMKNDSGKTIGSPVFSDKGEEFYGERIEYNFKTSQGTISLGETKLDEGYYFGQKIKRISQSELFVENGCYTTCSDPHPHYYFGSPEMKVVAQDRVLLDPLIFYVEDMPVFIVPFGLYFPTQSGRQSGLIIPTFFFSKNRGVTFENLGLYLALSDYYDTKITTDLFSKGGYTFKNYWQWKLTDHFSGDLDLQAGRTRTDPDADYTSNYSIKLRHAQTLTPQSSITANLSYASQNFNRNTNWDIQSRIQQTMASNASYTRSFDNGGNFSLAYNRNQNIITDAYTQGASISYSLPSWKPLKKALSSKNWLGDLAVAYSGTANWSENKTQAFSSHTAEDGTVVGDTSFNIAVSRNISHSPSISISPKFGYFTVTPSISFRANNYFRRLTRTMNPDSTLSDKFESGFFTEYNYSFGVNASTRLFGIAKPKILGINAVRHTFEPSIGYSFSPDLSSNDLGFYGSYYDYAVKQNVKYSRYQYDGGGIASRVRGQNLNYGINNSFEAKLASKDTAPDVNIVLLRYNLSGSYNFTADSLKFSDISTSFRTPDIGKFSFSGSSAYTLYDDEYSYDANGAISSTKHKVNKLLMDRGKGFARMTGLRLNASYSISSESNAPAANQSGQASHASVPTDSLELGERFRQRIDKDTSVRDFFGDNTPGFTPFSFPWSLSATLSYNLNRPYSNISTEDCSVNLNGTFRLTDTWNISASTSYNLTTREIGYTSINLSKDIHCWRLDITWQPVGYSAGFYLKFAIKAPQLQDLKIEKRNTPLYR